MTLHVSRSLRSLLAAGLCLGSAVACTLAAAETGRLLSRVFLPEDYRGEVQVTDVVQTADGLIYASNLGAVKEFDGRAWRTIIVPASWIMDLAAGADGRVYIAGVDELGFLEPGPEGRRVYRSILDQVPAELKPLGQAWAVAYYDGAAHWSTEDVVLRWREGVLHTWRFPDTEARRVLYHGGRHLYHVRTDEGLFRLAGDTWEKVSDDPQFKRLPPTLHDDWGGPGLSFVDRDGRLWRMDDATGAVTEVPGELAGAIAAVDGARLSDTVRLRDGRLAIITKNAGIFVIKPSGEIDLRFGTEGGLNVLNLFSANQDHEGGLWVGAAYGCVRVELDPSLTVFDQKNGAPPGNMYALARHAGELYACGQDGLYRFTPGAAGAQGRFTAVPDATGFIPYNLLNHPTGLIVVGDVGLFRYVNGVFTQDWRSPHSINSVTASATDPHRVFVGGVEFVHSLQWDGTAWRDEGEIAAVREDARSLVEDAQGVLWIGTPSHGVARVRRLPGRNDWQSAQVDLFATTRGLPEGHDWVSVYKSPVGPLFTHAKGVSAHDPATDRLVPARALDAAGVGGRYTYPLTAGKGAAMWMQLGYPAAGDTPVIGGLLPAAGGGWEWKELSAGVYSALGFLGAGEMVWESDAASDGEGVLWILGQQAIVRWDLNGALRDRAAAPPAVVLRGVARGQRDLSVRPDEAPRLAFARDPLRVQFASPVYAPKGNVEYQYRLLGYDERWSGWSQHNEAMFTNLTGGAFTFEVRARRGGGEAGPVTAWNFSVRPPWWRSAPVLGAYLAAAVALVWLLVRWRVAVVERERERLERVVRERTEELARERDRAEAANRAKTMFLASMSHELRTPLHAILGYSQLLGGDQTLPDGARDRLQIVANSGQHLLRLINEVLDLSKIEAGKLELRNAPFELPGLLSEIVSAQEARAAAKGLVFRRPDLAGVPERVVGDAQKLRQVLDNLLGNAVKFTARGEVRLGVVPVAAGCLHVEVSDTGPGIAPEDLRRLFEPFTQAGAEAAERGSGLGLTIAQRLVALMGGELHVASTVGEGSRFWFEISLAGAAEMRASEKRAPRRLIGYEGPRRRVLAIDDVEANRLLFRDLLAPLGFEVALAGSADEALALLGPVRPDLVILDLRMPGTNGFALARILRSDPRLEGVKILAASASVFGHDPGEALAAGCDAFISKPFLPEDFFARVGQLLALSWREAEAGPAGREEPLSPALLEALQNAARLGDVVALREAFSQLQARHPRAAALAAIEQAIDAFDTDRVALLAAQQGRLEKKW